ncbi:hypothetical protein [Oscillibacter sp.]|uniref:hypothetical protein n=1 Tax=Oscillibacter sp. TaxID=1945593 RepID=UPI00289BE020|nr:hypothetical protein [Oscillibacter sp.]
MKKSVCVIMTLCMIFALGVNASALQPPNATMEFPDSYEAAMAMGYDDYLTETAVTRGTGVPSTLYDLSTGTYEGFLDNIRTGIYTNYYFYPNSNGKLTFSWNVRGNKPLDGSSPSWKVLVGVYDIAGGYIKETKEGAWHSDFGSFHEEELTFSNLSTSKKYCFFISVYNGACQIWGDCYVSR